MWGLGALKQTNKIWFVSRTSSTSKGRLCNLPAWPTSSDQTQNIYCKLKYVLVLLKWKMMFFTRKFLTRIRELHLAGIIAFAVTTALNTGPFICWSSYSIAQSAVPSTNFTPRHDCKSWKTSPQHKTTLITKTACERDYFLLILVSSAPANLERRNLIRQTWGAHNNILSPWSGKKSNTIWFSSNRK